MKKLVLLGNSIASVRAVELLKDKGIDWQITLIPLDENLPVQKEQYADIIFNQTKMKKSLYKDKDFYEKNSIELIIDKKATRVNVSRKKIHFDDRSQMDFDYLIVADTTDHRYGDLKGLNKAGVFGFNKIKEIEQIKTLAALNDTITIQSNQWWALQLGLLLAQKDKEIILSVKSSNALIHGTTDEYQQWLIELFKSKGVSLLINNPITDILGESDVKAVRVQSGKVFATELVVIDDTKLDTRIFSDALELDGNCIFVNEQFCSNIDNVFAVDIAASRSHEQWTSYGPLPSYLEYQGQCVAKFLSNGEAEPSYPIPEYSFEVNGVSMTAIGQVAERRGINVHLVLNPQTGVFLKMFEKENKVVGALGLNAPLDQQDIKRCIQDQAEFNPLWEGIVASISDESNVAQHDEIKEDTEESNEGSSPEALHESNMAS